MCVGGCGGLPQTGPSGVQAAQSGGGRAGQLHPCQHCSQRAAQVMFISIYVELIRWHCVMGHHRPLATANTCSLHTSRGESAPMLT